MKLFKLFGVVALAILIIQACGEKPVPGIEKLNIHSEYDQPFDTTINIDTRGFQGNGEIYTEFDCPDSRFFSPINLNAWEKTPVVNGRLPTYKETITGMSIHTYGGNDNPDIKPYNMTLPKLAYRYNSFTKLQEVVVVIQIVQTPKDTVVGYRYLSGGVGGSLFRDFRFLNDEEVKKTVEEWKNMRINFLPRGNKC